MNEHFIPDSEMHRTAMLRQGKRIATSYDYLGNRTYYGYDPPLTGVEILEDRYHCRETKMYAWLQANTSGDYHIKYLNKEWVKILFQNEQDAMMFKLLFG